MKKEEVGFLEEEPGVKSSTRLKSFILLAFYMAFNVIYLLSKREITEPLIWIDAVMLVGIFTPQYLHKVVEVRKNLRMSNEKGREDSEQGPGDISASVTFSADARIPEE